MHHYITQLIEYLQEAHSRKPSPRQLYLPEDMKGLEDIIDMEMSLKEDEHTMESIFGVPQIYFPPMEKLTDEQMESLVKGILALWRVFHYEADLPRNLPARYAYPLLVACWKKSYPLVRTGNGTWHIEFCDYEPERCPFPQEYCRCKEWN